MKLNNLLILVIALIITSLIFGFIWPKKSWRWGLWMASPIYIPISLSVAFAGYFTSFFKYDLPVMIAAILAACSGSFIGAWLKNTWKKV